MDTMRENVIEFLRNDRTMTATLCQGKYVTKVKKLAERYPNEVQIVHENADGSIVAHLPTKALKLSIIKGKNKEGDTDEEEDDSEVWSDGEDE